MVSTTNHHDEMKGNGGDQLTKMIPILLSNLPFLTNTKIDQTSSLLLLMCPRRNCHEGQCHQIIRGLVKNR